jgi:hypothetical protein
VGHDLPSSRYNKDNGARVQGFSKSGPPGEAGERREQRLLQKLGGVLPWNANAIMNGIIIDNKTRTMRQSPPIWGCPDVGN